MELGTTWPKMLAVNYGWAGRVANVGRILAQLGLTIACSMWCAYSS